jgi:hypothetical protein
MTEAILPLQLDRTTIARLINCKRQYPGEVTQLIDKALSKVQKQHFPSSGHLDRYFCNAITQMLTGNSSSWELDH